MYEIDWKQNRNSSNNLFRTVFFGHAECSFDYHDDKFSLKSIKVFTQRQKEPLKISKRKKLAQKGPGDT